MTRDIPAPCPLCGGLTIAPSTRQSTLLAVCSVLVLKALEHVGKYLVRAERARYAALNKRPFHIAHTLWQAPDQIVTKALKGAWDVVPALLDVHGCCDVGVFPIVSMLDEYVHDLVITGTPHTLDELGYRFRSRLGLPVFTTDPVDTDDHYLAEVLG